MAAIPSRWLSSNQQLVDAFAGRLVEIPGRLVRRQQAGLQHQRARQRHPLLLAAD
jgi:hypothetical protein